MLRGTELDGQAVVASTPWDRILATVALTLQCLSYRRVNYDMISGLLGVWVPVLQHRRAALCLLDYNYRFCEDLQRSGHHQRWDVRAFDEMVMLVAVAPVLSTDLRATVLPRVYSTDASLWRAGAVSAPVHPSLAKEVWRFADNRGYHT